jgi:DNA-binding XRE family transcriptional regulator
MENQDSIEIQIAMMRAKPRITQAQIGRDLKISRAAVNKVINGRGKSKRVMDYLRKKLAEAA